MLQSKLPAGMATEPLENLTEQSARVGTWLLSVATTPRPEEYTYSKGAGKGSKGGGKATGKKFECLLVSEDSSEYCLGLFQRRGKEPAATNEFDAALRRFTKGSVWNVNRISLVKKNTKYLGCSHKVVIDLNTLGGNCLGMSNGICIGSGMAIFFVRSRRRRPGVTG